MWHRSGKGSGSPRNAVPLRHPPPHPRRFLRRCWSQPESPRHHRPLPHCGRMPRRCSSFRPSPLLRRCSSSRPGPLLRRSPLCHCCHRHRRSTLRHRPCPSYPLTLRPRSRLRRSLFRPTKSLHRPRRRAKTPWCCCYSRCRQGATRSRRSPVTKGHDRVSSPKYPRPHSHGQREMNREHLAYVISRTQWTVGSSEPRFFRDVGVHKLHEPCELFGAGRGQKKLRVISTNEPAGTKRSGLGDHSCRRHTPVQERKPLISVSAEGRIETSAA